MQSYGTRKRKSVLNLLERLVLSPTERSLHPRGAHLCLAQSCVTTLVVGRASAEPWQGRVQQSNPFPCQWPALNLEESSPEEQGMRLCATTSTTSVLVCCNGTAVQEGTKQSKGSGRRWTVVPQAGCMQVESPSLERTPVQAVLQCGVKTSWGTF